MLELQRAQLLFRVAFASPSFAVPRLTPLIFFAMLTARCVVPWLGEPFFCFFFFLPVLVFSDLAQYDRLVQMVHAQPKLAELFGH